MVDPTRPHYPYGTPAQRLRSDKILHRIVGNISETVIRQSEIFLHMQEGAPIRLPMRTPPAVSTDT